MTNTPNERESFSLLKRAKSFIHAGRGVWIFVSKTHNAWIHAGILIVALLFGFYFHIDRFEWMMLVFAAGFVLVSEAFNSAIEIDIDLTSPEYHPFARDTKDVAAGAVLISSVTALIIGILVFGHHIWPL